jgi:Uma2 family endonuclease
MAGSVRQQGAPMLSVAAFREWLESRPENERWELIEGVPIMMMTPPTGTHQRIVTNVENLLNAALKRHAPHLAAYHEIGVNIVSTVPYDPEPDVAVIAKAHGPDARYFDGFLLAAEVLYPSDRDIVERKRAIYRAQERCECVLLIRQERAEATVDERQTEAWRTRVLTMADELALPAFGLSCPVRDIYQDTWLA